MKNRIVHVARDGKVIGQYPPEQVASLLETGGLFSTDLCYSESNPAWTPIEEFVKKTGTAKFSRTKERATGKLPERRNSAGRASRKNQVAMMVASWIALLLAAAMLVGSGFWIFELYKQLGSKDATITEMKKTLAEREKENQRLLFVSREIAEPGTVRGSLVLRNEGGKRIAIPGTQVNLFRRKEVEDHLDRRFAEAASLPPDSTLNAAAFLVEGLPQPQSSTTTDASGRFEFSVPEPGDYVLIAAANASGGASRLWFVSFDSRDPLNTLVELTEANTVQQFLRSLIIVQGR
ncbi:MAG: hypothetical protein ACOYNN_02445 [Terrimicrobiaceae bacterium]